jgi:hypothetical protein
MNAVAECMDTGEDTTIVVNGRVAVVIRARNIGAGVPVAVAGSAFGPIDD